VRSDYGDTRVCPSEYFGEACKEIKHPRYEYISSEEILTKSLYFVEIDVTLSDDVDDEHIVIYRNLESIDFADTIFYSVQDREIEVNILLNHALIDYLREEEFPKRFSLFFRVLSTESLGACERVVLEMEEQFLPSLHFPENLPVTGASVKGICDPDFEWTESEEESE
jgi:hypothetical protein